MHPDRVDDAVALDPGADGGRVEIETQHHRTIGDRDRSDLVLKAADPPAQHRQPPAVATDQGEGREVAFVQPDHQTGLVVR